MEPDRLQRRFLEAHGMTDSPPPQKTALALKLVLAVAVIALVAIVWQRGGFGAAATVSLAGAAPGSRTPTLKPNPKNQKAYLDVDDPAVQTTDLGPNRWKIIDIHEHAQTVAEAERLLAVMDRFGVQRVCLMSSTIYTFTLNNAYGFEQYRENNEVLLQIKERWPDRFCAFVTFDPLAPDHLELVKDAVSRGADGVKLYLGHGAATGKGPFHVMPLDDERLEPFWAFVDDAQLPVLMHVNLIKFWDETISLLERHPHLRLCIPHFGLHKNTEARLQRLGWIFDRYPHTFTDVGYGYYTFQVEGFEALAKWKSRSREFIKRYAERIMFASDMVLEQTKDARYIEDTLRSYRQFHEQEKLRLFLVPSAVMRGLELDDETLTAVYERSGARFLMLDGAGKLPDRRREPRVAVERPPIPPLDKESIPHDPQYLPRAEGEAFASSSTITSLGGKRQTTSSRSEGGGGEWSAQASDDHHEHDPEQGAECP
jgi:predicted TIM-barrel fold metal-dependent hydrolase